MPFRDTLADAIERRIAREDSLFMAIVTGMLAAIPIWVVLGMAGHWMLAIVD
jgi:hypothetical protein